MKRRLSLGCAVLVGLAWLPAQAQVLYDAFSGDHIDPTKWIATPMCADNAYDCAREVRLGHLRLAVRGYGATTDSTEVTFAESQLLFKNPSAIETIQFRFTVTSFTSQACPFNDNDAHPQLLAHGAFFAGAGEDAVAYLMVERLAGDSDPSLPANALRVAGFTTGTTEAIFVDLGTVKVWEPAVATLTWDKTSKAFVWRVVKAFTTPHVVEETRHYVDDDASPPADAFKSLRVGTFAPNCVAEPSVAAMDVNIDNVRVNP